mmetsp:Transcript_25667/g.49141  ORF Transcript_25667/g.49141 Transcript_25667/m.49141 type:complete len:221 (+) Transcript_25667:219-881(+)
MASLDYIDITIRIVGLALLIVKAPSCCNLVVNVGVHAAAILALWQAFAVCATTSRLTVPSLARPRLRGVAYYFAGSAGGGAYCTALHLREATLMVRPHPFPIPLPPHGCKPLVHLGFFQCPTSVCDELCQNLVFVQGEVNKPILIICACTVWLMLRCHATPAACDNPGGGPEGIIIFPLVEFLHMPVACQHQVDAIFVAKILPKRSLPVWREVRDNDLPV